MEEQYAFILFIDKRNCYERRKYTVDVSKINTGEKLYTELERNANVPRWQRVWP